MRSILLLISFVLLLGLAAQHSSAEPGQFTAHDAETARFFRLPLAVALPMPTMAAPALLGLPSSVMPPRPAFGAICSTRSNGGFCSAQAPGQNCSAQNGNGNQCSTGDIQPGSCSVNFAERACSIMGPVASAGVPSTCSAVAVQGPKLCSAIALEPNQRCTTKGQGTSQCSAFGAASPSVQSQCSVLNGTNAPFPATCSAKVGQPAVSKACSAFVEFATCSIAVGYTGTCTTFGAADPSSCSAHATNSFCSVIGGAPGNPCVQ